MPLLNKWIPAEEFEGLDVDFVCKSNIDIIWKDDYSMFMIVKLS